MRERYTCGSCGYSIESWDEGNPYLEYPPGKRHYFYHPCGEDTLAKDLRAVLGREPSAAEIQGLLRKHGGNAPDHLCPDCGKLFRRDPRRDLPVCPVCWGGRIFKTWRMGGQRCPKCGGKFSQGEYAGVS